MSCSEASGDTTHPLDIVIDNRLSQTYLPELLYVLARSKVVLVLVEVMQVSVLQVLGISAHWVVLPRHANHTRQIGMRQPAKLHGRVKECLPTNTNRLIRAATQNVYSKSHSKAHEFFRLEWSCRIY